NLTITKALLNVIADAKTKVYGDADPSLTYQVSGLKNGDTAGAVLNGGSL
ncbi:MBG domain-containing protein, partial [Pseudomonas aeruginosa]